MRRTSRLRSLRGSTIKRLDRLRRRATGIPSAARIDEVERQVSDITINLLNTWANFGRAYYLSCMLAAARHRGGRVSVGNPGLSLEDAIGQAVRHFRPYCAPKSNGTWHRRDEPTWYDPNKLIPICVAQKFSNLPQIYSAFSLGSRVFADLPVFRNYFAHRNQHTRDAASNCGLQNGVPSSDRPTAMLLTPPLNRPYPLIAEWIDDVYVTVDLLCD
jgi:hypothetical protein